MMDAVIMYVNGADPEWQKQYAAYSGHEPAKRFRDWGMLPWQIRSIRRFMPFVDKIYLVVALPSQVPAEVADEVTVVLHKDIIPGNLLPQFNAATIEMFLHRIPGLSNRFLFLNDDLIPLMPSSEEDFFEGDKICRGFSRHLFAPNLFKKVVRNSDALARKAAGLKPSPFFIRPQHTVGPLFKDVCEDLYTKYGDVIESTATPTREATNLNYYFYQDYLFHAGRVKKQRLSCRHFSMGAGTPAQLEAFLKAPDKKWICINDVEMSPEREREFREVIAKAAAK